MLLRSHQHSNTISLNCIRCLVPHKVVPQLMLNVGEHKYYFTRVYRRLYRIVIVIMNVGSHKYYFTRVAIVCYIYSYSDDERW